MSIPAQVEHTYSDPAAVVHPHASPTFVPIDGHPVRFVPPVPAQDVPEVEL